MWWFSEVESGDGETWENLPFEYVPVNPCLRAYKVEVVQCKTGYNWLWFFCARLSYFLIKVVTSNQIEKSFLRNQCEIIEWWLSSMYCVGQVQPLFESESYFVMSCLVCSITGFLTTGRVHANVMYLYSTHTPRLEFNLKLNLGRRKWGKLPSGTTWILSFQY